MGPTGPRVYRLRFAARKASQAIDFMLHRNGGAAAVTNLLTAVYFADRTALNRLGRPAFGGSYVAESIGPVSVETLELLRGCPLRLAEAGWRIRPWSLSGYMVFREISADPETSAFAEAELPIFRESVNRAFAMRIDDRSAATHGRDWTNACLGPVNWCDMVDPDNPHRDAILEDLADPEFWRTVF